MINKSNMYFRINKKAALMLLISLIGYSLYANDLSVIKQNYIRNVLSDNPIEQELISQVCGRQRELIVGDQMILELMDRCPVPSGEVEKLLTTIRADGSWPHIDYISTNPSGWSTRNHALDILKLAKVFSDKKYEYYRSERVEDVIHKAIGYWFDKKPVSPNWWYNDIGIPKIFGSVFILFEDRLTEREMRSAIELMKQSKIGMTGQNKVWLAGNVLVRGLLENDAELVRKAGDVISSEIKIAYGKAEGVKVDDSFHQHGPMQQFGNYGAAYIATISYWAYILYGTEYAFAQDKYDILHKLINYGFRRVLWKGNMDINCLGRQFFMYAQRHKAYATAFAANSLSFVDNNNKTQYEDLIAGNTGDCKRSQDLLGNYHFWKSDMTTHRRANWMSSVKMGSERTIATESSNSDNIKGYYLGDGATYTYIDGTEYENIYPCWDWRKIPGVTAYQSSKRLYVYKWLDKQNQQEFVGNVNDGRIGLTSMDLLRDGLRAKKTWLFTDDYVLCLGAGISSDSAYQVTTTIEQSVSGDDFLYKNGRSWVKAGKRNFEDGSNTVFLHNNIAYVVLDGNGTATTEYRTNSWHEIMSAYPENHMETKKVFTLYIDHGAKPDKQSYQYLIVPASDRAKLNKFDYSQFEILDNSESRQLIRLGKHTFLLALHQIDEKGIALGKNTFRSNKAGLFIIRKAGKAWEVIASDPTQKETSMQLSLDRATKTLLLPDGEDKGRSARILF